jgi:hypothetical protein
VIVEKKLKYHSNQNMIDLYIAENVSKITNLKKVVVVLDSTEDQVMVEMIEDQVMVEVIEALDLVEVQETKDQTKCLLQPVGTVEMNAKYHSNQNMTDLFIAKNVSKIINHKKVVVTPDLTEVPDMIKVLLNSKEIVLQFIVEAVLLKQNLCQMMMILILFILLLEKNYFLSWEKKNVSIVDMMMKEL